MNWSENPARLTLSFISHGNNAPQRFIGELAQLGERLVCNQEVTGSSPVFSTLFGLFFYN